MVRRIVALAGPAGSGKDYTFSLLRERFHDAKRSSFAEPLKKILIATDPIVDDRGNRLSDVMKTRTFEEAKREIPEVRRLLQRLGTEGMRENIGKDVFVNAAFDKIEDGITVFTDLRFENEERAVRDAGGCIVRITRPGVTGSVHASETSVSTMRADHEFSNDGSREGLESLLEFVGKFVRA